MKIKLCPVRTNAQLQASVVGDVLTMHWQVIDDANGSAIISTHDAELDFGPLGEGDALPQSAIDCPWIASDVERIDSEIRLTLMLPHGANAPHDTRFPAEFYEPMTVTDGPVSLPPYDVPPADDVQLPEIEPEVAQ